MRNSFEQDEMVIMHSEFTDEDTIVMYRGPLGNTGRAVVYFQDTGMQLSVPMNWLRHQSDNSQEAQDGSRN